MKIYKCLFNGDHRLDYECGVRPGVCVCVCMHARLVCVCVWLFNIILPAANSSMILGVETHPALPNQLSRGGSTASMGLLSVVSYSERLASVLINNLRRKLKNQGGRRQKTLSQNWLLVLHEQGEAQEVVKLQGQVRTLQSMVQASLALREIQETVSEANSKALF